MILERPFECTSCEIKFEARVSHYEAPACPKCKDSEYVIRAEKEKPSFTTPYERDDYHY